MKGIHRLILTVAAIFFAAYVNGNAYAAPEAVFNTDELAVTEGGDNGTFFVTLSEMPTGDVTLNLSSEDVSEFQVSPPNLLFTPGDWDQEKEVTVIPADDAVADGNVMANLLISFDAPGTNYAGSGDQFVSVLNVDNEIAGVSISKYQTHVTTEDGGTAIFRVRASTPPTDDVHVTFVANNPDEALLSVGGAPMDMVTVVLPSGSTTSTEVTLIGQGDGVFDGDQPFEVEVTSITSTGDAVYRALRPRDVFKITGINRGPEPPGSPQMTGASRPDLLLRKGSGPYKGDNRYSRSGSGQKLRLQIREGQTRKVTTKLQNDGSETAAFRLSASRDRTPGRNGERWKFRHFQTGNGGRKNLSAALSRGHQIEFAGGEETRLVHYYQLTRATGRSFKAGRTNRTRPFFVSARGDGGVRDTVIALLKFRG